MANITPITKTNFVDKSWRRHGSYGFAAKDTVAPLVMQELPKAAMVQPIGFILDKERRAIPVAVQGVQPGSNLLVTPEGKWRVAYIPAIYRGYPFSLGTTEDGQQLLCIDEDSGQVIDGEGESFFTEDGEPSKAITDILKFLVQVEKNRRQTRTICHALQQHELIQPWPIKIKSGEQESPVEGLYRIDEQKLNELDKDSFETVRQSGALPLIYSQLLSMQHLPNLAKLAAQLEPQKKAAEVIDIEELFGEKDDLISFD